MALKDRPIERWTLRELLNESQRLCRELTDHLNTDYMPRVRELARLLRPHRHRKVEVSDTVIVHAVDKQQTTHEYANKILSQLLEILQAIHTHADREVK